MDMDIDMDMDMDSLVNQLDNLLSDGRVPYNLEDMVKFHLHPEVVEAIENRFEEYEKVSISFLFFDDIDSCFQICQKCIKSPHYNFMSDNIIFDFSEWDVKAIECFFYIKNFGILRKLGILKFDAERYYKTMKYVSKQRFLFYKICENLSLEETENCMKSIPHLSSEKYLETYILKVMSSENHLKLFRKFLYSLNNPTINSVLIELFGNNTDVPDDNPEVKTSLPKSLKIKKEDVYPIKNPENVGLCIIVNEVNIKDQATREGSEKDASLLESTFKHLRFVVKTFTDVPKKFFEEDFSRCIDNYFESDHSVFVMIILSHGEQGAVMASDNKTVSIAFIVQMLTVKGQLNKIPKVLIVQACQGKKLLLVDNIATDGAAALECDNSTDHRSLGRYISDFLSAESTVPGFRSFRDRVKGSWFIQSLCHCLKEHENECITSIITRTIKMVKDQPAPTHPDVSYKIGQQPVMRSLLDKKLYFKPLAFD